MSSAPPPLPANATATITPAGDWASDVPLVVDSATYWTAMNDGVPGPIVEHAFAVRSTKSGESSNTLAYALIVAGGIGIVVGIAGFMSGQRRRTTG